MIDENVMHNKKMSVLYGMMIFTYVLGLGVFIAGLQIYLIPLVCFVILAVAIGMSDTKRFIITRDYGTVWGTIFIILCVTFISNTLNGVYDTSYSVKMLILFVVPIVLCISLKEKENYEMVVWFMLIAVAISSVVAICQTLRMQWAIDLWYSRFGGSSSVRTSEIFSSLQGGRSAGLSSYSLNFAFQIVQVFPLALMLLKDAYGKRKLALIIMSILLFLGGVSSGTRMAIIVCVIEFICVMKPFNGMSRQSMLKMMTVAGLILIGFYYMITRTVIFNTLLERMELTGDGSFAVRLQTMIHYFSVWSGGTIINILFGFGHGTMNSYRGGKLGSGHNCITNMLFQFGALGLCFGLTLYVKVFHRLVLFKQNHLAKAFLVGLTGYLLMSLTNDSGLLDGDIFHIYYLSALATFVFMTLNDENVEPQYLMDADGQNL